MHTYLQQTLTRVVIHRTQVAKKKWKLRARFSPTKEDRVHQTKISTKTDKGGFSPAVFRSRLEQKTPFTEYFVFCVCVLFSMAKSMLRMSSVFVSVAKTFHSFAISAAKVPSVNALEFRCCRIIPQRNQRRTFDKRISCITRHDDFSPRSHRAVSLQVATFPRECKDRGSRRRTGLTENEWVYSNLIEVNLKEEF